MTTQTTEFSDDSRDVSASHVVHAILHFLRVIYFRKSVMTAALLVAALLGILYWATAQRQYQSDARLLIRQSGGDVLSPSAGVDLSRHDIVPTHCQLITSTVVLQDALRRLRPEHRVDLAGYPVREWVAVLEENLSVTAIRRTNIVVIRYHSKHPTVAAAVVQAVTGAYIEFVDRTHKGMASEIIDILGNEKVKLERKLEQKEAELLAARRTFGDLGIQAGSRVVHPLVQRAISFNEALTETKEKRLELQATLAAIQTAIGNGEDLAQHLLGVEEAVGREILLASLGLGARDAAAQAGLEQSLLDDQAEMKSLAQYYGPAHPRVQEISQRIQMTEQYLQSYQGQVAERLARIKSTRLGPMLVQMLSQAVAKYSQQERALEESFTEARQDAVKLNGDMAQLDILNHDVKRLRGFHDALVSQIANTDLRQEQGDVRVTIVKPPTPSPVAVSPRLATVAFLCAVGGLVVGSATVYVLDILDDRYRSPEEIHVRLGVPVLALVRELSSPAGAGLAYVQANVAPDAAETEAFRTLRTALALSPLATERIVVSSSEPGDGKTTVLVNLAVSFAQSGRRTLLIDADLRRPGLTSLLAMKGEQGLSDVLRGDQDVAALAPRIVQSTELPGLDILVSGPRRPNPSELLASSRFADLLAWAETRYDQVFVDSPPVLAASDAQIVGRLVDGVVLVVHADKNRRRVVERAIDRFVSLGIAVSGVVVNRIRPASGSGYGYEYDYDGGPVDGNRPQTAADSSADYAQQDGSTDAAGGRDQAQQTRNEAA